MTERIKIKIKEDYADDYISRRAGEFLREKIIATELEGKQIEIDFSHTTVASISFFDEGFAKLVDFNWDGEKLKKNIILTNINLHDLKLLKKICHDRGLQLT